MYGNTVTAKKARDLVGIKPGKQAIYIKDQLRLARDIITGESASMSAFNSMMVERNCAIEVIQRLDDAILDNYKDISIIETTNFNSAFGGMFILLTGNGRFMYFSSRLFHSALKNMYEEFEVVIKTLRSSYVYKEGETHMPILMRTRKNEWGRTLYGFPFEVFDISVQDLVKLRRLSAI